MRVFIFFILATCAFAGYSQPYVSAPAGTFTLSQVRGCAPLTVTLSAPTCDGSVGCDVDYLGNNTFKSIISNDSFTFTTPGTYTVRLVRGAQIDNIQVQVFASIQPAFEASNCGGNRVSVRVTDTNYSQYVINYNDGTQVVVPSGNLATNQHTFATPGAKTIDVRGRNLNAADNCAVRSQTVNVLTSIPAPAIQTVSVINNSQVRISYNGVNNVQYRMEVAVNNSNNFQQIRTLINKTIDTLSNITPDQNYYCFRIGAYDPCNNITTYSPVVCSINFDLAIANNSNNLSWVTGVTPNILNQRVSRSSAGQSITSTVSGNSYADTDVECGVNYCYQLTINYTGGSQSISLPKCGDAISTDKPPRIENVSTIVSDTGAELRWTTAPGVSAQSFNVFASPSIAVGNTTTPSFTDPSYTPESARCYTISYEDRCGNVSDPGVEACPMVVMATVQQDNNVFVSWSGHTGWTVAIDRYILDKYDPNDALLESIDVGQATQYLDESQNLENQVYIYVVRAVPADASVASSVSNRVTITKNPNLFYPTAFTPNNDGLNDVFNVYGQYIQVFEMSIFNRWGELMFTTTDISEGWDGSYNGRAMPEGTYTFVARITDRAGRSIKKSGSVLLLRKN